MIADPRGWVWGCGGIVGIGGHHGQLDQARTLRVPRALLPAEFIAWVDELGLGWYIDRTYPL